MSNRLRVIDLTDKNITGNEDVKVTFSGYKEKSLATMPTLTMMVYNPGMTLIQEVTSLEARDPLDVGYTGFTNERLCILCDLSNESIDKLIALENFISQWHEYMFRIPEGKMKQEISLVFTALPYTFNEDTIPVPKNKKIAAALKWQVTMSSCLNIRITAIGDFSAPIDHTQFGYIDKKVYVDTCLTGLYNSSLRSIVHVINPMSDILWFIENNPAFEDCTAIWISPSILSMIPYYEVEDAFIGKFVVKNYKDVEFLNKMSNEAKEEGYMCEGLNHVACIATSLHDFMTFEQDLVILAANTRSTGDPLKVSLFVNYTPEKANDQELYHSSNNLMDFIEDRTPIVSPTFYVDDINSSTLADVDKHLLQFIPKNIEIYPTKLLSTICSH